ncbi:hypothetical protein [Nocardioides sp. SYSU DS0651]|uniref:hypothetical protein n=1 Tax=Nocardioides sp. SYSU DS0651 TaxID=3415955 RepID=UPI003F4BD583
MHSDDLPFIETDFHWEDDEGRPQAVLRLGEFDPTRVRPGATARAGRWDDSYTLRILRTELLTGHEGQEFVHVTFEAPADWAPKAELADVLRAREVADTGARTDLDDALTEFGFDRANHEAELGAEGDGEVPEELRAVWTNNPDPLDRLRVIRREQYAHLDKHGFLYDAPSADPDELGWAISEILRLRDELAEARRIGTWLYDHLPPASGCTDGARRRLRMALAPRAEQRGGLVKTTPVAAERDGRLVVVRGVPYEEGPGGEVRHPADVTGRLDALLTEMLSRGSQVCIRHWQDR